MMDTDKAVTQMMRESAPEMVRNLENLLASGESVEELKEWACPYFAHKFHSPAMKDTVSRVIDHLNKQA